MLHEKQLAVGDARKPGTETTSKAEHVVLVLHHLLGLFPIHAVRRIGDLVAERLIGHLIVGECIAKMDVRDVAAFQNSIAFADGI